MVRIFVSSRRPCDSDAFATSSYGTNLAHPLSAATFVSAAVSVVLPWSICPMVPTFTCGLLRSNFSLAMSTILVCRYEHSGADVQDRTGEDRKSTRLNSSHTVISYAVFCLKKKI